MVWVLGQVWVGRGTVWRVQANCIEQTVVPSMETQGDMKLKCKQQCPQIVFPTGTSNVGRAIRDCTLTNVQGGPIAAQCMQQ